METARKVRVAPSLDRLVHETVNTHSRTLPAEAYQPEIPDRAYWLEFVEPIPLFTDASIAAMLFCRPGNYTSQIRPALPHQWHRLVDVMDRANTEEWSLDIIEDTQATSVFSLDYFPSRKQWSLKPQHVCPFEQCQHIPATNTLMPCEQCKTLATWFAVLLGTYILADQGFFREVAVSDESIRATRKVNVASIDSKPKFQEMLIVHGYHIISVDATAPRLTPNKPVEARGSWLAAHDESEIIRIEQVVTRTYKHERYKNMRGIKQQVKRKVPVLRENAERTIYELHAGDHQR